MWRQAADINDKDDTSATLWSSSDPVIVTSCRWSPPRWSVQSLRAIMIISLERIWTFLMRESCYCSSSSTSAVPARHVVCCLLSSSNFLVGWIAISIFAQLKLICKVILVAAPGNYCCVAAQTNFDVITSHAGHTNSTMSQYGGSIFEKISCHYRLSRKRSQ